MNADDKKQNITKSVVRHVPSCFLITGVVGCFANGWMVMEEDPKTLT